METDDPSVSRLRELVMGFRATHLLYVAAELGIADLLRDGSRDSAELAARLDVQADALQRVLRGLAQLGVVADAGDGRFALTSLGDGLRSDRADSLRSLARFWGHEMQQRAWGALLHSVRTGETAFEHVFGMPAFAYLNTHPDDAAVYNEAMATMPAPVTAEIVRACDVADATTVVDVGGGNGSLMVALLRANPGLNGVVFDLPHARDDAVATIAAAGLDDRCRFIGGDFFDAVPAGADRYLLRWIIHDWDDERGRLILGSCRRAMPPHGRLLLIENLLPTGSAPTLEAVMVDITMLARLGGRERTESEYRALLTDAGFHVARVIPTASPATILECMPA